MHPLNRTVVPAGLAVMLAVYTGVATVRAQTVASQWLSEARASIGGSLLRSAILSGSAAEGHDAVTGELAPAGRTRIQALLPDWFLRSDQSVVRNVARDDGYAKDEPLFRLTPLRPDVHLGFSPPATAYVARWKVEAARWLLGLAAITETGPVRLQPGAIEATVHTIRFSDGTKEVAALDLDPTTHVPLRVRYHDQLPFPHPLPREQWGKGIVPQPSMPEETEVVLSFEDRKMFDGFLLPTRIRKLSRNVVFADYRFDEIHANPRLTPDNFKLAGK